MAQLFAGKWTNTAPVAEEIGRPDPDLAARHVRQRLPGKGICEMGGR